MVNMHERHIAGPAVRAARTPQAAAVYDAGGNASLGIRFITASQDRRRKRCKCIEMYCTLANPS